MTGVQLALDCEPTWTNPPDNRPARPPLPHSNVFDGYDLRTQGLTKTEINEMATVPLEGDYL